MNIVVMTNNGTYFQDAIDTAECETPHGKDAAFVVSIIIKAIEDIDPKHVVSIVTDGASIMKAAWDSVTEKFPHIVCQWCASHLPDLLMEDIGKIPAFSEDILLVKDVIKFINNHKWTFNLFQKKRLVLQFFLFFVSEISCCMLALVLTHQFCAMHSFSLLLSMFLCSTFSIKW